MEIGIIGTGHVATTLGQALRSAGHTVTLGSRSPRDGSGAVPLAELVAGHDVVVNATPGAASLATLGALPSDAFAGTTLIDLANAVTPALRLAYPDTSLGEQLQQALPQAKVVKTLNTVPMELLAEPELLAGTSVFLSGDDPAAKDLVSSLLRDLGWAAGDVIDLGGIETARAVENYLPLFFALMGKLGPRFTIRVERF